MDINEIKVGSIWEALMNYQCLTIMDSTTHAATNEVVVKDWYCGPCHRRMSIESLRNNYRNLR